MAINDIDFFLKDPLIIWWELKETRAKTIPEGIWYAVERWAEWIIGSVSKYVWDIVWNYASAGRDVLQGVSGLILESQRWHNGRLKNMWLALSWAVAHTVRWTANIALWILWWADKLYRNVIVDAHNEISASSIDKLWKVGMTFGNVRRIWLYLAGILPRAWNEIAKLIDTPLDWFQQATRPSGREVYSSNLRFK